MLQELSKMTEMNLARTRGGNLRLVKGRGRFLGLGQHRAKSRGGTGEGAPELEKCQNCCICESEYDITPKP